MARAARQLVICIDNSGYEVSLERRKIYLSIPDARAEKLGQLRVIDESGEDYLYPKESFVARQAPTTCVARGAASRLASLPQLRAAFSLNTFPF
jgi:hypothetical protein